jgi:hypothetical protein
MSEFIYGAACKQANVYVLGTWWKWLVRAGAQIMYLRIKLMNKN